MHSGNHFDHVIYLVKLAVASAVYEIITESSDLCTVMCNSMDAGSRIFQ